MVQYAVNSEAITELSPLEFTQAEAEGVALESPEMESIGTELAEGIRLEDVKPESVAASVEGGEGAEAFGSWNGSSRPSPSSYVNKQLLKTFTVIVKKLVKKIMSNPRTRAKLQAAIRKGPTAVAQLITPSVAQVLPSYFRWMAPIYVPPVTRVLFSPIRKEAGVPQEQVEVSESSPFEWDL